MPQTQMKKIGQRALGGPFMGWLLLAIALGTIVFPVLLMLYRDQIHASAESYCNRHNGDLFLWGLMAYLPIWIVMAANTALFAGCVVKRVLHRNRVLAVSLIIGCAVSISLCVSAHLMVGDAIVRAKVQMLLK